MGDRNIEWERQGGRTTIHCIRKALVIDKEDKYVILDLSRPTFSDRYFEAVH